MPGNANFLIACAVAYLGGDIRAQPGTEHLMEIDKRLHGLVLSHDFFP